MTNNEPEFNKTVSIPVQLSFFFNRFTKEIPFSSSSLDSFFETTLNPEDGPPFLKAFEERDKDFLISEWLHCLELKENETRSFAVSTRRKQFADFLFTVMTPAPSLLTDQSLLLLSVTRTIPMQENHSSPALNKESAEFIELAAHDLDSPLRKLSTLIDRISNKYGNITDKDTQGYLLRATTCLSDMRSIIDNLAALARLGNMTRKKNACDIEVIVREALKDLQELAGQEKIQISTNALPVLQGDNDQYRQLFTSLLENAWKFRKKEIPAQIDISSEVLTAKEKQLRGLRSDNSYYKITVSDRGIGFKQEYAEKVFQPFIRLNGKSEYPGNGIGLAICKKIVKNHCGIIDAESEENFGARFILILPVSPD